MVVAVFSNFVVTNEDVMMLALVHTRQMRHVPATRSDLTGNNVSSLDGNRRMRVAVKEVAPVGVGDSLS